MTANMGKKTVKNRSKCCVKHMTKVLSTASNGKTTDKTATTDVSAPSAHITDESLSGDSCPECMPFPLEISVFGKTTTLRCHRMESVATLKDRIQDLEGIPSANQQLHFSGRILESGRQIQQYNIRAYSTVRVSGKLFGGGWTCTCQHVNSSKTCSGCGKPQPSAFAVLMQKGRHESNKRKIEQNKGVAKSKKAKKTKNAEKVFVEPSHCR